MNESFSFFSIIVFGVDVSVVVSIVVDAFVVVVVGACVVVTVVVVSANVPQFTMCLHQSFLL